MKTRAFSPRVFAFIVAQVLVAVVPGRADVRMPDLFSEHAVLQRSPATPVWGWAGEGEEVGVSLAGIDARTVAGKDGRWTVSLDLEKAAAGPHEMLIQGRNKVVVDDVVIGEVWLASGQSNMAAMLKNSTAVELEIAHSSDTLLREFHVDGSTPDGSKGRWTVSGPEGSGAFSAVAYYFAKSLRRETGRPVGIINAARPGTEIEAWMSGTALGGDPELAAGHDVLAKARAAYPESIAAYQRALMAWLQSNNRKDPGCADPSAFAAPGISTDGWTPITLPGKVGGQGLPQTGVIWLRKEIEIPASLTNETVKMMLGVMEGFDTVYWNGEKIAGTPPEKFPGAGYSHYYVVPPALIKPGKAVIAIRVFAPAAAPAFGNPAGRFWVGPISLVGGWLAKAEFDLPPLSAAMAESLPQPPKNVKEMTGSELFNTIIAPIAPYRLAGFLWYQGESNTGRAFQYRKAFPLLIDDWRRLWADPGLPFYFCQLANHLPKQAAPGESPWAELREAQSMALAIPSTGQAVFIDLGESDDIHPRNKKDAGERLARVALAKSYGKRDLAFSGPAYDSMKVEGKTIRVKFICAGGGLAAKPLPATYDVKSVVGVTAPLGRNSPDSEVEGFAICGADHRWVWADARIEGDSVVVWSDKVPSPIAVRYAWADNPTCNLSDASGLPAAPFRTDDFPGVTADIRFGLEKKDGSR